MLDRHEGNVMTTLEIKGKVEKEEEEESLYFYTSTEYDFVVSEERSVVSNWSYNEQKGRECLVF
jgi:hypothetical protein